MGNKNGSRKVDVEGEREHSHLFEYMLFKSPFPFSS